MIAASLPSLRGVRSSCGSCARSDPRIRRVVVEYVVPPAPWPLPIEVVKIVATYDLLTCSWGAQKIVFPLRPRANSPTAGPAGARTSRGTARGVATVTLADSKGPAGRQSAVSS
jgi:hypothetical protein